MKKYLNISGMGLILFLGIIGAPQSYAACEFGGNGTDRNTLICEDGTYQRGSDGVFRRSSNGGVTQNLSTSSTFQSPIQTSRSLLTSGIDSSGFFTLRYSNGDIIRVGTNQSGNDLQRVDGGTLSENEIRTIYNFYNRNNFNSNIPVQNLLAGMRLRYPFLNQTFSQPILEQNTSSNSHQGAANFRRPSAPNIQSGRANNSSRLAFEGRELIEPSSLDENAYFNFASRVKAWNCRTPGSDQILSVMHNSGKPDMSGYMTEKTPEEYRQEAKGYALDGSAIIDKLNTLRHEGLIPETLLVDISFGRLRNSESPILFPSGNPNHSNIVIVAGNGITLKQMQAFFSSTDARRRFAIARQNEIQVNARFPRNAADIARAAQDCRSGLVPRPRGLNY